MCAVRDSIVMAGTLSSAEFEALVRQNLVAFAAFLQSNVVAAAAGGIPAAPRTARSPVPRLPSQALSQLSVPTPPPMLGQEMSFMSPTPGIGGRTPLYDCSPTATALATIGTRCSCSLTDRAAGTSTRAPCCGLPLCRRGFCCWPGQLGLGCYCCWLLVWLVARVARAVSCSLRGARYSYSYTRIQATPP